MIEAKTKNDGVETTVKGNPIEAIKELMFINAAFVDLMRKQGAEEQDIEKQLVNCVVAGFEIADKHKK